MGKAPENDKAVRYLQQLDETRCAGNWSQVPELCRKIAKHAPHRKCLALTARCEAQIATYATQKSAAATSTASSLFQVVPLLLSAIEAGDEGGEESFQATVCLGWLYYIQDDPKLAVDCLPADFGAAATHLSAGATTLNGWTRVCLVKGTYIKASALEKTGATRHAVATFTSIIPWLTASPSPAAQSVQLTMWTEYLLIRLCQLSDQSSSTADHVEPLAALRTYRSWARFWEGTTKSGASGSRPRRLAWQAYFNTLSVILRHDLEYEPESMPTQEKPFRQDQLSVRMRQRAELKRVETVYENLLIKETKFPMAHERNYEVEHWVEAVTDNWRFMCGPARSNDDLGEGGKEGLSRNMLDILYRAATKTFHSTLVLRNLFIVHASLAEFELAFKAYDSYIEIIAKAKDQAQRTSGAEAAIDDDSTILRTSAEAIRLLCSYGMRSEAEKALEVGQRVEKWMEQSTHQKPAPETSSGASVKLHSHLVALSDAYCAIGISQAHWARLTYHVEERADIQTKATQYLRKSLSSTPEDSENLEAMFALALVLAETRDISGAIKIVKQALSSPAKESGTLGMDRQLASGSSTEYGRERRLISFWHLLALLLTSRSDFVAAEKACEAAFQQFGDAGVLFGTHNSTVRDDQHVNYSTKRDVRNYGIVDRMERVEKTRVLQIKMTQLALLEEMEGTAAAIDGSDELLSLYARLFHEPAKDGTNIEKAASKLAPPQSAAGTVRSSIFRGRNSVRAGRDVSDRKTSTVSSVPEPSAMSNSVSGSSTAQIANDESILVNDSQHRIHFSISKHEDNRTSLRKSLSKLQKKNPSVRESLASEVSDTSEGSPSSEATANSSSDVDARNLYSSNSSRKSVESGHKTPRQMAHNMIHAINLVGDAHEAIKRDAQLTTPTIFQNFIAPGPIFCSLQERQHNVSLLCSVWIFISGLFTRAQMYEDAQEAVDEAFKLVEELESEIIRESFTIKALSDKGWGSGKSVEELWADVFTARGQLHIAQMTKHQAKEDFERALLHFPDHPQAIVGVSNILIDIYNEIIPSEPPSSKSELAALASGSPLFTTFTPQNPPTASQASEPTPRNFSTKDQVSPPELNRLAARDRASGLLSTLTKLGTGWDYSEAWYALARAHEDSGQIDKAMEVLWWCVELEDTRPLREWKNVSMGGFVL